MQHQRPGRQKSPENNESLHQLEASQPWAVSRLSPYAHHVFTQIRKTVTRQNQGLSKKFLFRSATTLRALEAHPERNLILHSALRICERHWPLVNPYFTAVTALPKDKEFVQKWTHLADALSRRDTGVGNTFMHQTPRAISLLKGEAFFRWATLALDALDAEPRVWKAVKTYLVEALKHLDPNQWTFLLGQAVRIVEVSVSGAEALLQSGRRICSELDRPQQVERVAASLQIPFSPKPLKTALIKDTLFRRKKFESDTQMGYKVIC